MNKTIYITLALITLGCTKEKSAVANIQEINKSGIKGTATFTKTKDGTRLDLEINGAQEGPVAVHIHEGSECDNTNGAKAGGHWNPTGEQHGLWGVGEFHSGDIGNIKINKTGYAKHVMFDAQGRWTIGGDKTTNVMNRTIIIHSGFDDGKTQPSGNAGGRIGCGGIVG